jgi:hypothetical protein
MPWNFKAQPGWRYVKDDGTFLLHEQSAMSFKAMTAVLVDI